MISKEVFFCILFVAIGSTSHGQLSQEPEPDSTRSVVDSRYLKAVGEKAGQLEKRLRAQNARTLKRLERQELRMQKKLAKIDSVKAIAIFGNVRDKYARTRNSLGTDGLSQYIGSVDTIETSLKFLQYNPSFLEATSASNHKIGHTFEKLHRMKKELQGAEDVKKFIKERQQYLKDQLSKFGLAKELKKLSKLSYYSIGQLNAYNDMLKDRKKAERKAMEVLSKTKLFQSFMRKNSVLASLFRLPGDPNDPNSRPVNLAGLQTRAQVNGLIQQQIVSGGPNAQQQFQQNLHSAQREINQLKDKLLKAGAGNSDADMPDFKVNDQRKKSFWQKWELGANIQNSRGQGVLPVSSTFGLSAGFRPHDNFIVGLGFAGRIGWGRDIRHISVSYSGIGARSFLELKIKGSFHAAGGFEMNYLPEIRTIEQLNDRSGWQASGLLGISKIVSVRRKFFKQTKLQLLWDFLSYQQAPRGQAIQFRIGYNF